MEVDDRLRRDLRLMNLTDYEARTYLALLTRGEATAKELSEVGGVPQSRVYGIIRSLCNKGWAVEAGGRPARYKPTHPAIAIEASKNRLLGRIDDVTKVLIDELTPLYEARVDREKPDLWIIRGEKEVIKSIREVVSNAKRQLSLAVPYVSKELIDIIYPIAALLRERGGSVQVLLGSVGDSQNLRRLSLVAEIRERELTFGGGVICDTTEVILIILTKGERRPSLAIHSAHAGLTNLAKNYFDLLWATSSSVVFD
ncbi:MAG: hypothetical protein NZ920_03795 [Aigarchaeota archaeon]|nr:hypothetical protein [Aigarchaeota archaeon]MDW8092256.1 helix-turn-helix domain-containing protein [Nitrososphaerota archaeon]